MDRTELSGRVIVARLLAAMLGFVLCLTCVPAAFAVDAQSFLGLGNSEISLTGKKTTPDVSTPAKFKTDAAASSGAVESRSSTGVLPLLDSQEYRQSDARSMLAMVNDLRAQQGASALTWDENLEMTAMQRAAEILYYFSHTRPDGTDCFTAFPSNVGIVGENIAFNMEAGASTAFSQWRESPGHYSNMISSDFNSIGIACVSYQGMYFWVQCFGGNAGSGMVTSAYDGVANVVITVPDSFVTGVSYDNGTRYVGVGNAVDLPSVEVSFYGMFDEESGVSGSIGYTPDAFNWIASNSSVVNVVEVEPGSGIQAAYGSALGAATLNGTAVFSNRVTMSVPVVVGGARRLSGEIRYDTMQSIVQEGFSSAEWAVVASGDAWPDSLAASGLAGSYDAPVILTSKGELSAQAASELQRLGVKHVLVVGGDSAVSANAYGKIQQIVGADNVSRVAGETRVSTSIAIARQIYSHEQAGASKTAVIAASTGFADGLSCSPYAYASSAPVILVDPSGLTSDALDVLRSAGVNRIIVMGGTNAVPQTVVNQLNGIGISDVVRCDGATRYETSVNFADFAQQDGVLTSQNMTWASGENFPDALAGGALAGSKRSVLILTDGKSTDSNSVKYAQGKDVQQGYILGGTAAVSNAVMGAIFSAIDA